MTIRPIHAILLAALCAAWVSGGCAWQAERMAERAAPTGVEATLEMLAEDENRRIVADLAGDIAAVVASEATVRGLARGAVGGFVETFADERTAEQLAVASQTVAEAVFAGVGHGIETHLEPRIASLIETSIDQTIASLSDPQRAQRLAQTMEQVARTLVAAVSEAIADAAVEEIGPAVQATLREHVAPAIQEIVPTELDRALSPEIQAELQAFAAETSRMISREVVLGMNDAVEQRRAAGEPIQLPGTSKVATWLDRGIGLATIVAIGLALGAGIVAIILGIILSRTRRNRIASEWRLATALLLTQSLRTADGRQLDPELVDRIVNDLQESEGPESIIRTLKRRVGADAPSEPTELPPPR